MYPRRTSRRRPYPSRSRHEIRRLWVIAAATSVPVLIIAYALTTATGGRAADTADVTGAGLLHFSQGHTKGADGGGGGGTGGGGTGTGGGGGTGHHHHHHHG
jgi:hypothetical protein